MYPPSPVALMQLRVEIPVRWGEKRNYLGPLGRRFYWVFRENTEVSTLEM
jgi:hypothetical protein